MKKPLRYILALSATLSTAALAQSDLPATVVDLAAADADLSTLVSAVQTAGLAETLSSEGPFTVFAPSNAAFEDALAALVITVEQLLAREDLATILTYHVVPSAVMAEEVTAAVESGGGEFVVETVNGADISVTVVDGVVTLNGVASVVIADLMAGNGVVHVIDAVLLPPTE